ncbi:hypothetical protein BVX98_04680 [bacterium F11]|nr:hypothetical protein BVX98_04680 [bacterium F11]
MGLAEKRAVKEFQDGAFPGLKKQIDEAAGFDVPLDVNWDSLGVEGLAHLYADAFEKVYFIPVIEALKKICADDMGKEALKGSLKNIVLSNTEDKSGEAGIGYEGGTLKIDHKPTTNIGDVSLRTNAIVKKLESAL